MEIWKTMKEHNNYEISNYGKVRNKKTGRIRKTTINNKGYEQIIVYINKKPKTYYIHRLVASNFIENPNNYKEVNHLDENKLNNNVNNLEWCTKEYNTSVAWKDGQIKIPKGKNNKMYGKYGKDANKSKPIYQYDLQGNFIKKWDSQKDVERELGFRQNCISNCALGRCKSSYGYVWRLNYE